MTRTPAAAPLLATLILAACTHSEPFAVEDHNLGTPFVAENPARLSYSFGAEGAPAWLPEGTEFIYAFDSPESPDGCLGVMQARGGQLTRVICQLAPGHEDTTTTLDWPAVSTDGRIAYLLSSTPSDQPASPTVRLVVAPLDRPSMASVVRTFPFTGPDGAFYVGFNSSQWLGTEALAFIGEIEEVVVPCPGCDAVVVRRNNGIVTVAVDGGAVGVIPGTVDVTGIAAGAGADQLYLTRSGNAGIFLRTLSTGVETEVHRFTNGVPAGISVTGTRAAAVVNGGVRVVDLATHAERIAADDPHFFEHPIVTAAGDTVIATGTRLNDPIQLGSSIWQIALP